MSEIFLGIKSFFTYIFNQFSSVSITDIIDILLVSVIFFYVYQFIKERRAGKLITGIIVLFIVLFLSQLFNMYVLRFILESIIRVGVIALIIIFQPELRSALEKVGGEPLKSLKNIGDKNNAYIPSMIETLCDTCCELAMTKTGALIVIERYTKLGDIAKTGSVINADVNSELLHNIFFNKAPLHDGAVIISEGRILSAGCFLPLSTNDTIKGVGTRHRAALGMSENSDAIIIVVSEETGTISIASSGKLTRNFNHNTLKSALTSQLTTDKPAKRVKRIAKEGNKNE